MGSHLLHGITPQKTTAGIFTVLKMLLLVEWNISVVLNLCDTVAWQILFLLDEGPV
jgi:hypothetical protein